MLLKLKEFVKYRFMNIVFGISAILLFCLYCEIDIMTFRNLMLIELLLIGMTFCFKFSKRNNEFEKYNTLTKFKMTIIILLMIIIIIFIYLIKYAEGWDGVGYAIVTVFLTYALIAILLSNIIMRLYYFLRYKQKLQIKDFFKNHKIFLIVKSILLLTIIVLYMRLGL